MATTPLLPPWDGGPDIDIAEHLEAAARPAPAWARADQLDVCDDRPYEHFAPDHHKEWQ